MGAKMSLPLESLLLETDFVYQIEFWYLSVTTNVAGQEGVLVSTYASTEVKRR